LGMTDEAIQDHGGLCDRPATQRQRHSLCTRDTNAPTVA
jgi:hypothetical protein